MQILQLVLVPLLVGNDKQMGKVCSMWTYLITSYQNRLWRKSFGEQVTPIPGPLTSTPAAAHAYKKITQQADSSSICLGSQCQVKALHSQSILPHFPDLLILYPNVLNHFDFFFFTSSSICSQQMALFLTSQRRKGDSGDESLTLCYLSYISILVFPQSLVGKGLFLCVKPISS